MINQNIIFLLLLSAFIIFYKRESFTTNQELGEFIKPNPDRLIIRGMLGNENQTGITKSKNLNQDIRGT